MKSLTYEKFFRNIRSKKWNVKGSSSTAFEKNNYPQRIRELLPSNSARKKCWKIDCVRSWETSKRFSLSWEILKTRDELNFNRNPALVWTWSSLELQYSLRRRSSTVSAEKISKMKKLIDAECVFPKGRVLVTFS